MNNSIIKTKLLVTIVERDLEDKFIKLYRRNKVEYNLVIYGIGTASSSTLQYFGLEDVRKSVILSVLPRGFEYKIMSDLHNKLKVYEPGGGIAFSININSASKYFSALYDNYKESEEKINMVSKDNYQLIIAIVEEGYVDLVMTAAKKAGANGGTLLQGKGLGSKEAIKFLGLTIEPEKDVVLLLVPKEKHNAIMTEIVKGAGLSTPGRGICFSLPVDAAVGLSEDIMFEKI